jgi:hypothetical protein
MREAAAAGQALLGADLVLSSRQPFGPETEAANHHNRGEQSREVRCNSMAYFPKQPGRGLCARPGSASSYYGVLETEPSSASVLPLQTQRDCG